MSWSLFIKHRQKPALAVVFVFAILSLCPRSYGQSKDIEFILHGVSMHFNPYQRDSDNWNERNPGFGVRLPLNGKNSFAFQGGVYKNSFARTSLYAGIDWLPVHYKFIGMGAGLGAATGYLQTSSAPIPVGGPVLQLAVSDRTCMRFRFFPPVIPGDSGAFSLELSWRLHKKPPSSR
jgi:hypothetical protein